MSKPSVKGHVETLADALQFLLLLAMGDQSELLNVALSMDKPGLLPPDPFLRIGVSCRFALERMKAAEEL